MYDFIPVFNMSGEQVGRWITDTFGPVARYKIFRHFLSNGIKISEVARRTNVPESTIRNNLSRGVIPDRLSGRLFTGIANEWPALLRKAISDFIKELRDEFPFFREILEELEKKQEE